MGLSLYSWVINFKGYFSLDYRFTFLLSIIIVQTVLIITFFRLTSYFSRKKIQEIETQPITRIKESQTYLKLKKDFSRLKIWLLLPLTSFLLLFLLKNEQNLVSIVIDASGSMSDGGLETGKSNLINTLGNLNQKTTDFVISVSPHPNESECIEYTTFSDILKKNNPDQLCSYTVPLQNELPINLIQNLQASGNEFIFYAIWHNYLVSRQLETDNLKTYDNKIAIIISDFRDGPEGFFDTQLCNDSYGYDAFYEGNAFLINLKAPDLSAEPFVNEFENCYPGNTYEGYDTDNYSFAIEDIVHDLKTNTWYFPFWVLVIYLIGCIIIILLSPKKLIL
ncbi:hypothetical protein [Flavivirga spongiicola]|uniref:VWFA domain-containing protein n=1 Tax=Flavivirga spongiicola TaxID=421621 RepID=A0ABU7XZE4_9FLAO|nr:hypothetical protein [Flavivirga sp. MEBiC05379]MDO5980942.1 hypothetical protein [Flavivirga sp. MEBiC05379]